VETGSAITWKYPSCVLQGDDSVGEFYSVAVTNNCQQADTGTKMIHIGKRDQKHDRVEGDSVPDVPNNTYRGLVRILPQASGAPQSHAMRFVADRVTAAARTPCRISKAAIRRRRWNTKPPPRRLPTTSCSTCRQRGAVGRRRGRSDRQWLLQGSAEGIADGVRRRGTEAAWAVSLEGSVG